MERNVISEKTVKLNNQYQTFSEYINGFIKTKEEDMRRIRKKELANMLGMNYESLKKYLNGERKINSRDFIIAICLQLQLTLAQTNKALFLNGMPILSGDIDGAKWEYNRRDEKLIRIIKNNHSKKCKTIQQINNELEEENHKLLEIPYKNKIKKEVVDRYEILEIGNKISLDNSFFNRFESIETQYDINNYRCKSFLILIDKFESKVLNLTLYNDGDARVFDYSKSSVFPIYSFNKYKDISVFNEFFKILKNDNYSQMKKLFDVLDDTKNYGERICAKFVDNQICFFAECFNNYVPELNEYYFVKYSNQKWEFFSTNKSIFLFAKLGEQNYRKYNDEIDFNEEKIGDSIEEIQNHYINKFDAPINKYIAKNAEKKFLKLKLEIEKLIDQIKNDRVFIRNIDFIYEEPTIDFDICSYYEITNLFDFYKYDEFMEDIYVAGKTIATVFYKGCEIELSLNDIRKSFKYGLENINQILEIKYLNKSIDSLINNL